LLDQKTLSAVPVYDGRGILQKNGLFNSNLRTIGISDKPMPTKPIPT
jgi:hypothetical protein